MFRTRLIDGDKDDEGSLEAILDNKEMLLECDSGCINGIFYFTKDERLQDSQPCGKCHGKGWVDYLA